MNKTLERGVITLRGLRCCCAGLLVGMAGLTLAGGAAAVPVNVSFVGQVSELEPPLGQSIALGTPVSWSLDVDYLWDDRHQPGGAEVTLTGVSGWLKLGTWDYVLTAGRVSSFQYQLADGLVNWIQFEIEGTGPALPNGYFGGLFLRIDADRQYMDSMLQYAFPFAGGESYRYLDTEGRGTVTAVNDVPEPATAALVMLALLGWGWTAGRRASLRSASAPSAFSPAG